MTAARKATKRQLAKIAAQKAALERRITDMLLGVSGGRLEDHDGEIWPIHGTDLAGFSDWLRAMKHGLEVVISPKAPTDWTEQKQRDNAFDLYDLRYFDTITKAVEHLYRNGFRAE